MDNVVFLDDVAFLKDSDRWPNWPMCPVKRSNKGTWPDTGVVFAGELTVCRICMFDFTGADLKNCQKHKYDSAEAMVADGWIVD